MLTITKRHWSGSANLPKPGTGCVVVANHMSYADPLVIAHFLYDHGLAPRFMAKDSVFEVPVMGQLIAAAGQIPVARGTTDAASALAAAIAAVGAGECVVVYPEGTLTRDPDLWPMRGKTGAVRLALETGAPVVPVAHWGTQRLLPRYQTRPRLFPPTDLFVSAGPAVDLEDLRRGRITAAKLRTGTDRVMAAITERLEHLRGEPAPTDRFDPRQEGVPDTGRLP
jgi:1-acyl-sn-glycerol-3-phosphate acyltransferase